MGQTFELGSAVCTVLAVNTEYSDLNNTSIVLRIVYGETSFLFTGDAEQIAEQTMIDQGQPLQSTVLKVGHHGSYSSTSYAFLWNVMPQYAVISCGRDNEYGHPHDEPLSRLRDADVTLFRTDLQGDVVCTSDGSEVSFTVSRNADADVYEEVGGSNTETTEPETFPPDVTEWEYVTSVETGKPYILGMNTSGTERYFSGTTESSSIYYRLAATTDVAAAMTVYLEAVPEVADGYRLYYKKEGVKYYIRTYEYTDNVAQKGKGSISLTTNMPAEYYTFDDTVYTLVYTADADNSYYMGTYNSFTTFSASNTFYITGSNAANIGVSQFPARLYTAAVIAEPETTVPETTEPETTQPAEEQSEWDYTIADGSVTITDYTGSAEELVIPETIEGYPVTVIGARAFYTCSTLKSVEIPAGVTTIAHNAFAWCSNMASVTLPDSITQIERRAFYYCTELNNLCIPESVTEIGASAFANCIGLTNVSYAGSQAQWQNITIGEGNEPLLNANITFAEEPVVDQWNIALTGDLTLNFHLNLEETDQVKILVAGDETVLLPSQLVETEAGTHIVTVDLSAAQMTEQVTLQRIRDGEQSEEASYTVRQYADAVLADESYSRYHALVREMLNYGGCAQSYFGYGTDRLANEGITDVAAAEVPEAAETEMSITGKADGIAFYAASMLHRDAVAVRFYFQVEPDAADYQFAVDGVTCQPEQKGEYCYVELPNIGPDDFGEQIAVTVTDANANAFVVYYSPMNYITRMYAKGSESLQMLLKALYNYHLAAKSLS